MKTKMINISEPCKEDSSQMKNAQGGLFCESCQHSVIDFRDWSQEEIVSFFEYRGTNRTCGMFLSHQVTSRKKSKSYFFIKPLRYAALTLLGLFSMKQNAHAQKTNEKPADLSSQSPLNNDSIIYLVRGEVTFGSPAMNSDTLECMVTVINSTGDTVAVQTTTQRKFELHLPAKGKNESYTLVFSSTGFNTYRMENFIPKANQALGVTLEPNKIHVIPRKEIQYIILGGAG